MRMRTSSVLLLAMALSCWAPGALAETSCTDGIDDDGDGFTDCADTDCATDLGSALGASLAAVDITEEHGNKTNGSCDSSTGADVAFTWTAPAEGSYVFDTSGSAADTVLIIRSGCNGVELGCDTSSGDDDDARVVLYLDASKQVTIYVDTASTDSVGGAVLSVNPE